MIVLALTRRASWIFSLAVPAVLAGQQPRDTVSLRPIVVTATRAATPLAAVASAVTVLRGADLRARGIATVADALRGLPGASVVRSGSFGGTTSLFLRGGESDYVKVLLDGVPLNTPGGAFDWADLTTDDVDRIEVVRGPVSVLYGSDAVAGVVQIFTRQGGGGAGAKPAGHVGVEAGRYGSVAERGEVAGAVAGVGYSLGASRFTSDGLYAFNNGFRNTVVSGRLATAAAGGTTVSATARYGDGTYHFPTSGSGAVSDSNQFTASRELTVSLQGRRVVTSRLEAQLDLGARQTLPRFEDPPDSAADDTFRSADTVRRFTGAGLVRYQVGARGVLTAGVEREVERQRGRSLFAGSFGTFPDSLNVHRANTGYFGQAQVPLGTAVDVTLGTRVDDNQRFGTFWTWRAGVAARVGARTRLRASAGTGFKEPTFLENYGGFGVIGNPGLRPERSRSWELGVEREVGGRLSVAATYFDQRFRDLIDFTFAPPPPDTVNYFNVAAARASGLELEARLAGGARWSATASYTYLHTRATRPGFDTGPDALFVAGEPLLRRPAHSAALSAALAPLRRTSVTVTARYVGHRDDLDFTAPPGSERTTLRAYTRVDAAAEWSPRAALALRLRVENLGDVRYEEVRRFLTPRRSLSVGVEARY